LAIQEASTSLNTQLPPENALKIEEKPLAASFVNHVFLIIF